MFLFFLTLLFLFGDVVSQESRIIAVPLPGAASHSRLMWEIASGLAGRGHKVWLIVDSSDIPRFSSFMNAKNMSNPGLIAYNTGISEADWRSGKQPEWFYKEGMTHNA